jgi:hypothetical protein
LYSQASTLFESIEVEGKMAHEEKKQEKQKNVTSEK